MSRALWAAALGGAAMTLVLGGWGVTGLRAARFEAATIAEAPAREARAAAADLAAELDRRLEELRSREDGRPYYVYQNLYHDPRGASSGPSVVPSPLATDTGDPLIASHYQVDRLGNLTIPSINEELPELSRRAGLLEMRAALASLRASADELGSEAVYSTPVLIAAAEKERRRRAPRPRRAEPRATEPAQVVALSEEAYTQNAAPNEVFKQVKGAPPQQQAAPPQRVAPPPRQAPEPAEPEPPTITVTASSFRWSTARIEGRLHIVGRRQVSTPEGAMVQGFVIDPGALEDWIAERGGSLEARLVAGEGGGAIAAPVAALGGAWRVAVDPSAELSRARREGRAIERRFWRRFVSIAGGAGVLVALIVWIAWRAERLARQRSQFAAAAAHELRTPLAGLQLYGDMLADGLGDERRAADYARRVADEAGRLGRVVTNVLGFSQLERGALSVRTAPGDLAAAARRALERHASALEEAGVEAEVDLPEGLEARFDEDAVARILANLIDNGEKHTRESERRWLRIAGRLRGEEAVLEIADDGPGVPRRMRRRLFQPFARGEGDDAAPGLGLGLALSRELARAQGGELRHVAGEGEGARFELVLRRA